MYGLDRRPNRGWLSMSQPSAVRSYGFAGREHEPVRASSEHASQPRPQCSRANSHRGRLLQTRRRYLVLLPPWVCPSGQGSASAGRLRSSVRATASRTRRRRSTSSIAFVKRLKIRPTDDGGSCGPVSPSTSSDWANSNGGMPRASASRSPTMKLGCFDAPLSIAAIPWDESPTHDARSARLIPSDSRLWRTRSPIVANV